MQLSNDRYEHVRKISSLGNVFSEVGGLANVIYGALFGIYYFFGAPVRDIELAKAFQKLKEKHLGKKANEHIHSEDRLSTKYDNHISCFFYVKLLCYKLTPMFFSCCCDKNTQELPNDHEIC